MTYQVILNVEGQGFVELGDQLDQVTVTSGSTDGWEQPTPASCLISFLGLPVMSTNSGPKNLTASWWLGRTVGIAVSAAGTSPKVVFYGRVISVNATPQDSSGEVIVVSLTLQSKLGDLSNYLITNNRAIETETQRAAGLVSDGLATSWAEVGNNLAWTDVVGTLTWANYDSTLGINFDQNGTSTKSMVAYVNDSSSINDVMFNYAIGENGFFGERINYDFINFTYYLHYTQSSAWTQSSVFTIDLAQYAISDELSTNLSISDIYNSFSATNGTLTRTFEDPDSISQYGLRDMPLETQYSLGNDIDTMLAQRAAGRSEPYQALTSVTMNYDLLPAVNQIYFVGYLQPITLTNVPALYGGDQVYFVRGCQVSISYEHAEAVWILTPQNLLAYYTTWSSVDPSTNWASYATATTKWSDLT